MTIPVAQHENVHPLRPEPKMETVPGLTTGKGEINIYPTGLTNAGQTVNGSIVLTGWGATYVTARPSLHVQMVYAIGTSQQFGLPQNTGGLKFNQAAICAKTIRSVSAFPNAQMRDAGLDILRRLHSEIRTYFIADLPDIQGLTPEDGSLWIAWNSRHWRIGFTIETDPAESGWHLISDREHGDLRYSGDLASVDIPWLVKWALANLA